MQGRRTTAVVLTRTSLRRHNALPRRCATVVATPGGGGEDVGSKGESDLGPATPGLASERWRGFGCLRLGGGASERNCGNTAYQLL